MKHSLLFALVLLPFLAGCAQENIENLSNVEAINDVEDITNTENKKDSEDVKISEDSSYETCKNVRTRNYKNIKENELHPEVDDGYVSISSVFIDSEYFIDAEETITYLYKLSCKDNNDSFKTHRFNCDDDGCYYAEISETQQSYIPNGFTVLKNNNYSGSSVEIKIDKIYKCITYTELYYSETEQKIKIVDFNHVIPGLEEAEANSLLGKSVDYSVYVDESGIKSMNYGNLPFETELIINYIDTTEANIIIN